MSVSELCKLGMRVIFDKYTVSIQETATGKEVREGSAVNGVYKLDALSSVQNSPVGDPWQYRSAHMKISTLRGGASRSRRYWRQHREEGSVEQYRHASKLQELVLSPKDVPVVTQLFGGALLLMLTAAVSSFALQLAWFG